MGVAVPGTSETNTMGRMISLVMVVIPVAKAFVVIL